MSVKICASFILSSLSTFRFRASVGDLFYDAILAASNFYKIPPALIEKDYYITCFLEKLVKKVSKKMEEVESSDSELKELNEKITNNQEENNETE